MLTVGLAEKVDALESGPFRDVRFTRDQIQEIHYASLLHDFGKVGVREKVLIKGKKLYVGEMLLIRQRFAYIKRTLEAEHFRAKLEQVLAGAATPELLAADGPRPTRSAMRRSSRSSADDHPGQRAVDPRGGQLPRPDGPAEPHLRGHATGNRQPFLTPNELSALSIRRGSLSEKERREIESHVTHTFRFLSEIPWTGEFRRVPEIAYAHHEKLDGTGYPRRLAAAEIPIQSKMMTISDIFDALVAWDRPYKKSVPVEKALDILRDEAGHGKLDGGLLRLFIEAKVYERTLPQRGRRSRGHRSFSLTPWPRSSSPTAATPPIARRTPWRRS